MKNRILLTILIITLMFSICACDSGNTHTISENPQTEKSEEETSVKDTSNEADNKEKSWKELYAEFILDYPHSISAVSVNDLNLDGTPELILGADGASAAYAVKVYGIIQNKLEILTRSHTKDINCNDSYMDDSVDLYSTYTDNWISLRKNKNTGEYKYIISSHNGHSEGSFQDEYSIAPGEMVVFVNEFKYNYLHHTPKNSKYYIKGKEATEADYNSSYEEFFNTWEIVQTDNYIMTYDHIENSKKITINIEKQAIMDFFDMYKPELF